MTIICGKDLLLGVIGRQVFVVIPITCIPLLCYTTTTNRILMFTTHSSLFTTQVFYTPHFIVYYKLVLNGSSLLCVEVDIFHSNFNTFTPVTQVVSLLSPPSVGTDYSISLQTQQQPESHKATSGHYRLLYNKLSTSKQRILYKNQQATPPTPECCISLRLNYCVFITFTPENLLLPLIICCFISSFLCLEAKFCRC